LLLQIVVEFLLLVRLTKNKIYYINLWKLDVLSDLRPSIVSLFVHSILVYRLQFQDATRGKSLEKVQEYDPLPIMEVSHNKFPTLTLRNYKYLPLHCMNAAVIFQVPHMALHHILCNPNNRLYVA